MGYAVPARAQRLDADILKDELGCTVVRTSHYPQSHRFIDRCDEIGLLVITEIPGWQHIGGEDWKDRAVANTRDMVLQWRRHPSIIAWGVRINESPDDDALYERTNALARELDPTRPTTGVRNFGGSHLLEDVYAYNDFVHSGANRGCDPKKRISPDSAKGYFISEHNGHMFPTKSFDDEEHRLSQAMRHARVQDDAAGEEGIAGAIGWCMTDYQTHRDFGSGDGICHHGVMDAYRNPKLAAALYASQAVPTLLPSSSMDIGEHPGGSLGPIEVFTDADEVRLLRNGELVGSFAPNREDFPHLPHPPVRIEDTIGPLMERHEDLDHATAERLKRVFRDAAKFGPTGLSTRAKLEAAYLVVAKRFTRDDATRLYNTWMAPWGAESVVWRFEAVRDGAVVESVERAPANELRLEAKVDTTRLVDGPTWDLATVRIRALDEYGAPRVYAHRVVRLRIEGDAEIVGPDLLPLVGGAMGAYVRTLGRAGSARLTIECRGAADVVLDFDIAREEAPLRAPRPSQPRTLRHRARGGADMELTTADPVPARTGAARKFGFGVGAVGKDMVCALVRNDQAMVVVIGIVVFNASLYLTTQLAVYFFKYDMGDSDLVSLFGAVGGAGQILSMMSLPLLRKRWSARAILTGAITTTIAGYALLFAFASTGVRAVPALAVCARHLHRLRPGDGPHDGVPRGHGRLRAGPHGQARRGGDLLDVDLRREARLGDLGAARGHR